MMPTEVQKEDLPAMQAQQRKYARWSRVWPTDPWYMKLFYFLRFWRGRGLTHIAPIQEPEDG